MVAVVFRDFEIWIHGANDEDETYDVSVHVSPDDRRAEGSFRTPFTDEEMSQAPQWMEQGLFDQAFVREFGAKLFSALFCDEVGTVYRASLQGGGPALRVRLVIDVPDLTMIPWELMYDPDRQVFLSLDGPFVRGASFKEPTRSLMADPPLRVLVVDAFPRGVPKLEGEIEAAHIKTAMAARGWRARVDVECLPNVTLSKLQNALREASNLDPARPFHVLHFIGHGRFDAASGRNVLLFEGEHGEIDEVDAERMANIIRPYDLRLVFLNACESVQSSALAATRGFAPALMRIGVPAVIGMQATVLDRVATGFSRDFYTALVDNQPVDAALRDARQLHAGIEPRRGADLAIPVCYLRSPSGQIMELRPLERVPLTLETWRPWLKQHATPRRLAAALVGLVGLTASLLALVPFIAHLFSSPPSMTGDFNIAVAQFGALDAGGMPADATNARELSESLYERLNEELAVFSQAEGFDIEIRAPADTGRIEGGSRADRARSAARLALSIDADLIVYGNLTSGQESTSFSPEFFLSHRKLQNAEELVGQYELGSALESPADIRTNPAARKELRGRLLSRTRAVSQFVIGLGYYALRQFEDARTYFTAAERDEGWDDQDGKEVLYLFLGNAAGSLDDLAGAETNYKRSLELNAEYARARIGQAEVLLQRSHGTCENDDIDATNPDVRVAPEGLKRAAETFQSALAARDQPAFSDVKTKVAFGLGRVYLCLSQSLSADRWAAAEREFLAVIVEFDRGNNRVRDLATEAHANLAIVYLPAKGDPDAASKYRRAAKEYATAIRLARTDDRRQIFRSGLVFVCDRLRQLGLVDPSCLVSSDGK